MSYLRYTCENKHLFDEPDDFGGHCVCPYCGKRAEERDGKYRTNFFFSDRPGANIIDKSQLKNFGDGMADDIHI